MLYNGLSRLVTRVIEYLCVLFRKTEYPCRVLMLEFIDGDIQTVLMPDGWARTANVMPVSYQTSGLLIVGKPQRT